MPAVEVSGLAKSYGAVQAVAGVSFAAEAGAVTAVLGRNGAGKTTTLEICAGLRRADAGEVRILGLRPEKDAGVLRRRLGVMPQGGSNAAGVYPSARVGEVLRLYAALYGQPLPVDALLDLVGLTQVRRTPWRRLSGGEQQRLSLALALVGRPAVVFLDEPTAGLDVSGRIAAWDIVRSLRSSGVAVVLSTHALDEAERLADQVVIVDAGRVVASGTPVELTRRTDTAELRFDAPPGLPVPDLLVALPAGCAAEEPTPGHYVVRGEVSPAVVATVTSWCAERGVLAERITTGSRSLEEVFLDLTGGEAAP